MIEIKDSGEWREFETGAVRDIQEGKGRCDLMPLEIVNKILLCGTKRDFCLQNINNFIHTNKCIYLYEALLEFIDFRYEGQENIYAKALLELSKHFEAGAKKYGERNWEKGIPVHCYIDSAVRHFLKYLAGEKDEPHGRAFMWNIVCCIWTVINKPEMNDMKGAVDE